MRKLFFLVLVVALIPFVSGCRIDGLWGYEDNEPTVVSQNNNVQLGLVLPAEAGVIAANINGSSVNDVMAFVQTTDAYTWATMTKNISANGDVVFAIELSGSKLVVDNVGFVFKVTNGLVTRQFSIPTQSAALTTTGTSTTVTRVYEVTFGANDAITATYYATATFTGTGATLTFTVSGQGVAVTVTYTTPTSQEILTTSVAPDGVTYKGLSTSSDYPTPVLRASLDGAKFKVSFKNDVAVPTVFSIFVDNLNSDGSGKTLTNTDGSLSVAQGATSKDLVITLGTTNYTLQAAGKYKVTIVSAKANNAELLTTYPSFYLVIGTALQTWTGQSSTALADQLDAASTDGIALMFSGNLKSPQTLTGSVKLERYAIGGNTVETTTTISMPDSGYQIAGAGLTVPFGTKRLVSNKKYVVTYQTGKILDSNGYPVEFTPTITIYTK